MNVDQKDFVNEVILPKLVKMAIDGTLPLDITQLSSFDFDKEASEFNINRPHRKLYCGWMIEDAEHMFKQMQVDEGKFKDVEYTIELGEEIMDLVDNRFDADYGVTWDSIRYAIEEIMEDYE